MLLECEKPPLVLDIDDFVTPFCEPAARFVLDMTGKEITRREIFLGSDNGLLASGLTVEEATNAIQNGYIPSEAATRQPALSGAQEGIDRLAARFSIHFGTSRDPAHEEPTRALLDFAVPDLSTYGVHLVGNSITGVVMTKPELCRELGAEWMADDQLSQLTGLPDMTRGVWFDHGDDFQRGLPIPEGVGRATGWTGGIAIPELILAGTYDE